MLSLRHLLTSFLLVAGLVLAGCSHTPKAERPRGPAVSGTVIYITNARLPEKATIEVRLVELTREGRVDRVVTSETFPKPPTMPLEFRLPYQPGLIAKRQAYGLDAKIVAEGRTLFATDRPIPVLTRGYPDRVEIVVSPVKP
ncbi:MAG TPA: YbaY family lipoprotein [Opitutaceae bacterium]|nr:YbaY family lipoprotein [Opitutaceae bacterium]